MAETSIAAIHVAFWIVSRALTLVNDLRFSASLNPFYEHGEPKLAFYSGVWCCNRILSKPLFKEYCAYFEQGNSSTQWALNQAQKLSEIDKLHGIHYMPLQNTRDLITVLAERNGE
jgi:hypothetical protein